MNDYSTIIPLLQKVPLFKELNEADHKEIIDNITVMYYPPNYRVFNKGDSPDALYIIKTGKVRVFDEMGDIAILEPYHFFGEMALFDDSSRNAHVETMEETEVVILKRDEFFKLVESNENIAQELSKKYFLREAVNKQRSAANSRKNQN